MPQEFGQGQQTPYDNASDLNLMAFVFTRLLARTATVKVVKVMSVTAGADGLPGTVDVKPLVMQIDGQGNASAHGTVHNLPYLRLQAGVNAVVLEPVVGDIGLCVVCDRDISSVKTNKAESPPGSFRRFDVADGIYIGGVLNGAPTQFVKFTDDGMLLQDKNGNKIEMKSGSVAITAMSLTCTGSIIAGFGGGDQVGLQTHLHTSGSAGNPTTQPTPGT